MAIEQTSSSSSSDPLPEHPDHVSDVCSTLARPLILSGLFREILTRHFAEPGNIEDPHLRKLLWRDAENETQLVIEAHYKWKPELTEFRPAIIIKRNNWSNQRLGIGDQLQGPPADKFGNPHYTTQWTGSHTLFCIAGSGTQAELLGTEVYREIHHFQHVIRKHAKLKQIRAVELGEISELDEDRNHFVVPVTVGYVLEDSWVVMQEAPVLRSVRLSFIYD